MTQYVKFSLIAEILDDTTFTDIHASELLSDMEDLIMKKNLDLYNSEYDLDEEDELDED